MCPILTILVFSWQWLLQYQDKAIFKWVRYQKLSLPRAPPYSWGLYTAKYRYWSGLLLLVCILLSLISFDLNFSLDPHVDLMATVFIVGGLILLKGVTAKRVYKNWSLDVMETAMYLLHLSCFFSSHSVQCSLHGGGLLFLLTLCILQTYPENNWRCISLQLLYIHRS